MTFLPYLECVVSVLWVMTTEVVYLARGIGTDTACAGCCWVEDVSVMSRTHIHYVGSSPLFLRYLPAVACVEPLPRRRLPDSSRSRLAVARQLLHHDINGVPLGYRAPEYDINLFYCREITNLVGQFFSLCVFFAGRSTISWDSFSFSLCVCFLQEGQQSRGTVFRSVFVFFFAGKSTISWDSFHSVLVFFCWLCVEVTWESLSTAGEVCVCWLVFIEVWKDISNAVGSCTVT